MAPVATTNHYSYLGIIWATATWASPTTPTATKGTIPSHLHEAGHRALTPCTTTAPSYGSTPRPPCAPSSSPWSPPSPDVHVRSTHLPPAPPSPPPPPRSSTAAPCAGGFHPPPSTLLSTPSLAALPSPSCPPPPVQASCPAQPQSPTFSVASSLHPHPLNHHGPHQADCPQVRRWVFQHHPSSGSVATHPFSARPVSQPARTAAVDDCTGQPARGA